MKFMISSKEKPTDHSIHVVYTDLGSFILHSDMNLVDDNSQLVEILEVSDVISSVQKVVIAEGKEKNEECLQLVSSLEKIDELVYKTKCVETTNHPLKYLTIQPSEILFSDEENGLW